MKCTCAAAHQQKNPPIIEYLGHSITLHTYMNGVFNSSMFPLGPDVIFLNEPYQIGEEDGTLQTCFNVTRNGYQADLNYTFTNLIADGTSTL